MGIVRNQTCLHTINVVIPCQGQSLWMEVLAGAIEETGAQLSVEFCPQHFASPLSRMTQVLISSSHRTAVRPVPRSIAVDEGAGCLIVVTPPSPNCLIRPVPALHHVRYNHLEVW